MGLPGNCGLSLRTKWPKGPKNLITDVASVSVGHCTLQDGDINTGVTAVLPHGGNIFREKVMAGSCIINGFGKSIGLIQLQELGSIETPIIMTNTLSVGTAFTALTRYMLEQNPDIGRTTGTVNCLVTECNDGDLNDIRGLHIKEENVLAAIDAANSDFEEGAVGGGTGMCCLGLKGGIGSASRILTIDGREYTLGVLVMSNYSGPGSPTIGGQYYDTSIIKNKKPADLQADKGSIIMIIATDIPLSERQLNRVAKRTTAALCRTGSYLGNGSGDIAIAFTTANKIPHYSDQAILACSMFHDDKLDMVFEAAAEATEEAIISSLWHAKTTSGRDGLQVMGLQDFLKLRQATSNV